jgi:uncharacterized BrkB/YihY/UPF0761 family membrane protein
VCAAVGYELLQLLGGYYVGHVVKNASDTYGTFALVIGLLSFMFVAAVVVLLGAEVSAVSSRRLWPRSLSTYSGRRPTEADLAALEQRTRMEARRPDEEIAVSIAGERSVSPPPGAE